MEKKHHQLSFQRGEESKGFFPARNSHLPEKLTDLKRPAENSKKGFFLAPHGKRGCYILFLLQNLYIFLTESWIYFQCVFSALQISLSFSLSCWSPATGRADF